MVVGRLAAGVVAVALLVRGVGRAPVGAVVQALAGLAGACGGGADRHVRPLVAGTRLYPRALGSARDHRAAEQRHPGLRLSGADARRLRSGGDGARARRRQREHVPWGAALTEPEHGSDAVALETPVRNLGDDVEVVSTVEGTDAVHALIVGREITGLSAFSQWPRGRVRSRKPFGGPGSEEGSNPSLSVRSSLAGFVHARPARGAAPGAPGRRPARLSRFDSTRSDRNATAARIRAARADAQRYPGSRRVLGEPPLLGRMCEVRRVPDAVRAPRGRRGISRGEARHHARPASGTRSRGRPEPRPGSPAPRVRDSPHAGS